MRLARAVQESSAYRYFFIFTGVLISSHLLLVQRYLVLDQAAKSSAIVVISVMALLLFIWSFVSIVEQITSSRTWGTGEFLFRILGGSIASLYLIVQFIGFCLTVEALQVLEQL